MRELASHPFPPTCNNINISSLTNFFSTLSTIAIVLLRPPNTLSTSLSPGSLPRMFHTSTQRAPLVDHPPARAASVSATVCTVLQPRQEKMPVWRLTSCPTPKCLPIIWRVLGTPLCSCARLPSRVALC
eukprot:GGOE01028704.1.p2 GENE.GGOE01028704.1~~GGOE01028704.1.p2  ORF type:complete len:129 (-),score=2.67 GGOE01028704.1:353-739(-)